MKLNKPTIPDLPTKVAPRVGAWIETSGLDRNRYR